MGLSKVKCFDRGDHTVCIDKATGRKWKEGPGAVRKAANFAKATAEHVRRGRPKASLEVIQSRFAICSNCPDELFSVIATESIPKRLSELPIVGTCLHRTCGCFIHDAETFPNKLAWATQRCPKGNWHRVEQGPCKKAGGCCGNS